MAVTITLAANPASVNSSSNRATYASVSIGAEAPDRLVVVCVGTDTDSGGTGTIDAATIDTGSGPVSMSAAPQGNGGASYARIFYLLVPTGTTATFVISYGANPNSTRNHIAVYAVTGASPNLYGSGSDSSLDMDATDPLTTGSIVIPTDGAFLGSVTGSTSGNAKTWTNATAGIDQSIGQFRFVTGYSYTAGTTTITCEGTSNGEDGALSFVIFEPSLIPPAWNKPWEPPDFTVKQVAA